MAVAPADPVRHHGPVPVGLAARLLDHNDADVQPAAAVASALDRTTSNTASLTRDEILDNITLYWLTNTGVSMSRLYWEYKCGFFNAKGRLHPRNVTVSPYEQYQVPRSLGREGVPLISSTTTSPTEGGHFAAWEEPELLSPSEVASRLKATSVANGEADAPSNNSRQPPRSARLVPLESPRRIWTTSRRRIAATRWPNKELVDRSQGVQLRRSGRSPDYWANEYDWRK